MLQRASVPEKYRAARLDGHSMEDPAPPATHYHRSSQKRRRVSASPEPAASKRGRVEHIDMTDHDSSLEKYITLPSVDDGAEGMCVTPTKTRVNAAGCKNGGIRSRGQRQAEKERLKLDMREIEIRRRLLEIEEEKRE